MEERQSIINDLIKERRSIFPPSYIPEEIPRDIIQQIVSNANYAPTHRVTEPWRFVIFRNEGLIKLADEMARLYQVTTPPTSFDQAKYDAVKEKIMKASCVMAIVMESHPEKLPEWEEIAAVACAVQNMWLTATAYKIGAYWSTPGTITELDEFLDLTPSQKCLGLFYMGYHKAPRLEARRRPYEEKIKWVE